MGVLSIVTDAEASTYYLLGVAALGTAIVWEIYHLTYNIFFHPLRQFPGPLSQRASMIPWVIQHLRGIDAFVTEKHHARYGPVVRVSPKHLSFTDARAWRDIYGHQVGAKHNLPEMPKSKQFISSLDDIPNSIINADRNEHSRIRRALAHGFSDSSMRQQEPIIKKYVNLLLRRLREESSSSSCPNNILDKKKKKINAEAWYNWTTFDIAGDLIFGMSFGCLDSTEYHPWISFIFGTVRASAWIVGLDYLGFHSLVQLIFRTVGQRLAVKRMQKYTDLMLGNRLDNVEKGRCDLFEGLIRRREEWNLSFEQLSANAFILVLAGSETTATTLSGVTYLLLSNPEAMVRVKREVRESFKSAEEINLANVGKLEYMLAVLNESLRMFPPVTAGLVRVVPEAGGEIAGHFVPGGTMVEVQPWSINHSEHNWAEPWVFKPERFIDGPENASEAGNILEALQAFSTGPRNCIGRNLAYAEMRLILARLVYEFDMTLAEDSGRWVERQKAYTLWDRIPLNVYLTPVN